MLLRIIYSRALRMNIVSSNIRQLLDRYLLVFIEDITVNRPGSGVLEVVFQQWFSG